MLITHERPMTAALTVNCDSSYLIPAVCRDGSVDKFVGHVPRILIFFLVVFNTEKAGWLLFIFMFNLSKKKCR